MAAMEAVWQAGAASVSVNAFRTRAAAVVMGATEKVLADPAYAPVHPFMPLVQWDIVASQPLIFRGRTIGALNAYFLPQSPPTADEQAVLTTIADQAAVAVENARLFAETERRVRELDALYRADEQLHRSLHVEPVLQALVDVAVDLLQFDAAALIAWDATDNAATLRVVRNLGPEAVGQIATILEGYRGQPVVQEGEPTTIEDALSDPRVPPELAGIGGIRGVIQVPITVSNELFGEFHAGYFRPHRFDEDEVRLMTALAQRAATAIENARLYEQAHRLAALEERQRLARELHDSVSQVLFSISLGARTAKALLERDPGRVAQPVEQIANLADMGMAEMRALIFELRPESLQSEGLVAALTKQTAALRARHGITVDLTLDAEPDVPLEVKEAVYRIAQEAMHNTVKHARATRVRVHLASAPDGITLTVSDDGIGFDPGGDFPGHLGLRSMRERVTRFRGTLAVESAPGRGTTIHAAIPPG
jgi:signal transduction histidine kinase